MVDFFSEFFLRIFTYVSKFVKKTVKGAKLFLQVTDESINFVIIVTKLSDTKFFSRKSIHINKIWKKSFCAFLLFWKVTKTINLVCNEKDT